MARNGRKWLKVLEMGGNDRKLLESSENVWECLEMVENGDDNEDDNDNDDDEESNGPAL